MVLNHILVGCPWIVIIVRCLVESFVNSKREICNISILVKTVDDDRLYAIRNPFSGQFLPNTCHHSDHWCKRNWFNMRVVWLELVLELRGLRERFGICVAHDFNQISVPSGVRFFCLQTRQNYQESLGHW